MIYLKPMYGLCNRLRAIASAVQLAKARGDGLCVLWAKGPGMLDRATPLFDMQSQFGFEFVDVVDNKYDTVMSKFNADTPNWYGIQSFRSGKDVMVKRMLDAPAGANIFIETCDAFMSGLDYSWIHPSAEVSQRMNETRRCLEGEYIGVHIRRTDNRISRIYSPLYLFDAVIDRELQGRENARIFLATDDDETKEYLVARHGSFVVTRRGLAPRHAEDGILDGFVDLLLLSEAAKLFGSRGSSFSKVAAQIGNKPYFQVCEKNLEEAVIALEIENRALKLRLQKQVETADEFYWVRFHKCDGSYRTQDQLVRVGKRQQLFPMDSHLGWRRQGLAFKGWDIKPEANNVVYRNATTVCDLAGGGQVVNLFAVWQ